MPSHQLSHADLTFQRDFELGHVPPAAFDHAAHLRLAYGYLVTHDVDGAMDRMRASLQRFIRDNGVPASKYHETLTRAWLLAVAHFMTRHPSGSFAEFAVNSAPLFDSTIMLTHYSTAALFSERALAEFVAPDLQAIPS